MGHASGQAVHAGHRGFACRTHFIHGAAAAGGYSVGDRQHRNHPFLETVSAVGKSLALLASLKNGHALGKHELQLVAVIAEIAQSHPHFSGVVGSPVGDHMAAMRINLPTVRLRSMRFFVDEQETVISGKDKVLNTGLTKQMPG